MCVYVCVYVCVCVACACVLQCVAYLRTHYDVLQCVAACCSVLQRVAVCCSVLQCVAYLRTHYKGTKFSLTNTTAKMGINRFDNVTRHNLLTSRCEPACFYPIHLENNKKTNWNQTIRLCRPIQSTDSIMSPDERWGAGVEYHFQEI